MAISSVGQDKGGGGDFRPDRFLKPVRSGGIVILKWK
jgi:hypothetical protein